MPSTGNKGFSIGVDVGGTKLTIVLMDSADCQILKSKKLIISNTLSSLYESIINSIYELCPSEKIASIGLGLPGMVDDDNTMCFSPHIAALNGHNLAVDLKEFFNCPIKVENDANCALIAETLTGAAKEKDNVLMVTLGTGIGGSMIIDGKFLRGYKGFIGEIGHMTVAKNGNSCICGKIGCWETYAASSTLSTYYAVFKNYPELEPDKISRFNDFLDISNLEGNDNFISNEKVMDLYKDQDQTATLAITAMMEWVAFGLSSLNAVLAPEIIIIGGGIVSDFKFYEHLIDTYFKLYSLKSQFSPKIVAASNGATAGAVGAALLARY